MDDIGVAVGELQGQGRLTSQALEAFVQPTAGDQDANRAVTYGQRKHVCPRDLGGHDLRDLVEALRRKLRAEPQRRLDASRERLVAT